MLPRPENIIQRQPRVPTGPIDPDVINPDRSQPVIRY